jgi:hypothetical protein
MLCPLNIFIDKKLKRKIQHLSNLGGVRGNTSLLERKRKKTRDKQR